MDNSEKTSAGQPTPLPPAEAFGRAQRSPAALIRMVLVALFDSAGVWGVSFIALATPVRIFPDPGALSKYTETLKHLVRGSASADEELITLSLLTVWSIIWGCFLAALTAPIRRPELLRLTSACALFCFVSWLVGVLFLRHMFRGQAEEWFHVLYPIVVTGAISFLLAAGWPRTAEGMQPFQKPPERDQ